MMPTRRVMEIGVCSLAMTLFIAMVAACSSDTNEESRRSTFGGVERNTGLRVPEDDGRRCPNKEGLVEESMDTSGDNVADVRKVFRIEGEGQKSVKVLVCRELDLNHDGRKDIYRFYNEEGRPLREETDSDFDGTVDSIAFFENSRIVRQESDRNGDGRPDETRHFIRGKLVRVERDDNHDGQVDVWEHWEQDRLLRIGYDVDSDEVADFWHRAPPTAGDDSEDQPARDSIDDEEPPS